MKTEGDRISEQNRAFDIAEATTDHTHRDAFERYAVSIGYSIERWPTGRSFTSDHPKTYYEPAESAYRSWQAAIRHMREQERPLLKFQPCGCVICTCEDEVQCQGCGAKMCGTVPHPEYVRDQEGKV